MIERYDHYCRFFLAMRGSPVPYTDIYWRVANLQINAMALDGL